MHTLAKSSIDILRADIFIETLRKSQGKISLEELIVDKELFTIF